jgi:hypothetical protein
VFLALGNTAVENPYMSSEWSEESYLSKILEILHGTYPEREILRFAPSE